MFGLKLVKDKEIKSLQGMVRSLQNFTIAQQSRNIAIYPTFDLADQSQRYCTTDDIYSIVRMLSTTAALIPLRGYEIKGDESEELDNTDPLGYLLNNPSTLFSRFEFFESLHTFLRIDGECFLLKERAELGVNSGKVINLLFMHPQNVILKVSESLPRKVVSYDYRVNGQIVYEGLSTDDVIHIKYFNPSMSFMGNELRGLSPIRVLARRLTQLDSNTDVTTAQMQNGGIETIVYDKSIMDGGENIISNRKDNFYKFLKNPSNAGAPYFASGEMGALYLGSTLADMQVIEAAGVTFKKLCNAYGTSDILFNNSDASTESNVSEMVRRTYTNTILPDIYRVRDALSKGLLSDFENGAVIKNSEGEDVKIKGDGKKREIREDISEVTELQPNVKEMVEWLSSAHWLTPNEKRDLMKFERLDNPMFDEPLMPANLQTLNDLQAIGDLPQVTENGL